MRIPTARDVDAVKAGCNWHFDGRGPGPCLFPTCACLFPDMVMAALKVDRAWADEHRRIGIASGQPGEAD